MAWRSSDRRSNSSRNILERVRQRAVLVEVMLRDERARVLTLNRTDGTNGSNGTNEYLMEVWERARDESVGRDQREEGWELVEKQVISIPTKEDDSTKDLAVGQATKVHGRKSNATLFPRRKIKLL